MNNDLLVMVSLYLTGFALKGNGLFLKMNYDEVCTFIRVCLSEFMCECVSVYVCASVFMCVRM